MIVGHARRRNRRGYRPRLLGQREIILLVVAGLLLVTTVLLILSIPWSWEFR